MVIWFLVNTPFGGIWENGITSYVWSSSNAWFKSLFLYVRHVSIHNCSRIVVRLNNHYNRMSILMLSNYFTTIPFQSLSWICLLSLYIPTGFFVRLLDYDWTMIGKLIQSCHNPQISLVPKSGDPSLGSIYIASSRLRLRITLIVTGLTFDWTITTILFQKFQKYQKS